MAANPKALRKEIKKSVSSMKHETKREKKDPFSHKKINKMLGIHSTKQSEKKEHQAKSESLKKHAKNEGMVGKYRTKKYEFEKSHKRQPRKHSKDELSKAHAHMKEHMR